MINARFAQGSGTLADPLPSDGAVGEGPADVAGVEKPAVDASGGRIELSEVSREYAYKLLSNTREELVRADAKAALLLAAAGIASSALLNGLLGGKWSPFQLAASVQWIWWMGIAAAASAISALAYGVYPRTRRKGGGRPKLAGYYGDIVGQGRAQVAASVAQAEHHLDAALVDQIFQTSHIVERKYRCLRVAIFAFAAGAILCALSVLLS
ncbi:Pycsar system effector family protein [Amycolatopsis sp. La24]|uniref:Pycsar system effector family protein n=1 Tax=Amycolatopsis sp. La24 TaxID=3028304 RepID=UPI0023AFB4D2|nr:Pycsar system effector family protein [Amycolatopsis sp. La24]